MPLSRPGQTWLGGAADTASQAKLAGTVREEAGSGGYSPGTAGASAPGSLAVLEFDFVLLRRGWRPHQSTAPPPACTHRCAACVPLPHVLGLTPARTGVPPAPRSSTVALRRTRRWPREWPAIASLFSRIATDSAKALLPVLPSPHWPQTSPIGSGHGHDTWTICPAQAPSVR